MSSIPAFATPMQGTSVQTDEFPIGHTTTLPDDISLDLDAWQAELRQNWAGGHTQMPNEVRNDPSLSPKAKISYEQIISYMWFHKDHCWPGQEELAAKTGYSVRSIKRAIKELYERGYIEIEQRGMGKTNRYYLNPLSFVRSFRPISGPRTDYRMPHQNLFQAHSPALRLSINDVVPRPVEPRYKEVPNWHHGSDSVAPQEVTEWPSKNTKTNPSKSESHEKDSRSGSAAELGVKGGSPATIRSSKTSHTKRRNEDQERKQTGTKSKTVPAKGKGGAACAEEVQTSKRRKHGKDERPPALMMRVKVALERLSDRFCDQAPKSSVTRVARLYADMRQRGVDEYVFEGVMDQVRDVTIAKTPTITGRNKDDSIAQMPYFLSILEKTVVSWCKEYDDALAQQEALQIKTGDSAEQVDQEEQDGSSAPGDTTAEHVTPELQEEQQLTPISIVEPVTIQNPEPVSPAEQITVEQEQNQQEVELVSTTETIITPELASIPEQITAELEQNAQAPAMIIVPDDDPMAGWTETTATWWADRLRGYLGHDQYEYMVRPIGGTDRYGFFLRERDARAVWEEYYTKQQTSARWQQQADQWKLPTKKRR